MNGLSFHIDALKKCFLIMEMYLRGSKKKSSFHITDNLKTFPQKWKCIHVVRKKSITD